jgi:hypothetical protein
MAKALKTVLTPGYYVPKSKGDQDFERQHTVQTNDYRAEIKGKRTGSGDEVFNASKVKVADRKNASSAGKAGVQTSVSESSEITSTAAVNPVQPAWHHMDKFRDHAQDHLDAKHKAERSFRNAESESDEELKGFYKKLGGFYTKAAQHHKDMASHHAAKFNLSEETDYTEDQLMELSNATLSSYANKADKSASHMRKLSGRASKASMGRGTYDRATGKHTITKQGSSKLQAASVKLGAKSYDRERFAAKARAKIKEESDLTEASKKKLKIAVKKKYLWKNNKDKMRNANS